ncbi:IclR family transcriptional regulator [Gulosibacter molinativorax]|uniref:IclR family transcriptional regulator n=1 Tax=Gulosibacter molinativorax TaxID=256821 RepID=A0ABT7C895_9MICO|nr:IclR family transcriptional regulator [Gulosibacter molinativorax]MDJ1371441.1 IclR family transcriptional regulator [Gulosibacter molinativorax]
MNSNEVGTAGANVVGKVAAILRHVSTQMPQGTGTSEIARATALPRPTVHRLLSSLEEHGFIDRDRKSGHWLLGPELYIMGAVAAERYDISTYAADALAELAEATGESAFLSARRGDETICLMRQDGSFPIRSFVLYEGRRFPLGVASAGIAILSFLEDDSIERYLARTNLAEEYGPQHSPENVRERIRETRRLGYAVNPALIVEGSWGMGTAVFDPAGQPAWALSLTGVEHRFSAERRPQLGKLLLEHAHRLTQRIANGS